MVVLRLCSAVSQALRFKGITRFLATGSLLTLCNLGEQARAETEQAFRISAVPDEAPTELIRKFKPLAEYLSSRLDRPVTFIPVTGYTAAHGIFRCRRQGRGWCIEYQGMRKACRGKQGLYQQTAGVLHHA